MRIPLFNLQRQHAQLRTELLELSARVFDSCHFTSGQATEAFEAHFAQVCGVTNALGVNSGTSALFLGLKALGVGPGDEVITTPVSFVASADTIVQTGAQPVFVDVDPTTGNLDPDLVSAAVTPQTKAVLVVHLYGVTYQLDQLKQVCQDHQLQLIEDASHAHGSRYQNQPVGSWGDIGCFSLYPSKTLGACGQAGIIVSNRPEVIDTARMYASNGVTKATYYHHVHGYNERIDNLQAAILNLKLTYLPNWIDRKRRIAQTYNQAFHRYEQPGMVWPSACQPSLYVYATQRTDRDQFGDWMSQRGIATGSYYPHPLHLQPSMESLGYQPHSLPAAEAFCNQTISLPLYPELTDGEIAYIIDSLEEYFEQTGYKHI